MKTASPKSKKTTRGKKTRKKVDTTLSICPVNGAGWCPYPFSVSQLKKRMKKKLQSEQEEQLVAGES